MKRRHRGRRKETVENGEEALEVEEKPQWVGGSYGQAEVEKGNQNTK